MGSGLGIEGAGRWRQLDAVQTEGADFLPNLAVGGYVREIQPDFAHIASYMNLVASNLLIDRYLSPHPIGASEVEWHSQSYIQPVGNHDRQQAGFKEYQSGSGQPPER